MAKIKFSRRERGVKRSYAVDIVMYSVLLLFGILMAMPFVFAISNSLKPLSEFFYFPPRIRVENPTFDNFKDLFRLMSDSWVPFSRYIFNTAFITIVGTAGHILIASMCAYALAKHKFPGRNIIFTLIVTSLMFRGEVTAIPSFMIFSKLKMVDSYTSYILPALASTLGLYLIKQFMEQMVPDEILESARMDGASEFRVFWSIAMPMVKPAVFTLLMLSVQNLWNTGSSVYIR
ncbi:MAG: carbohydrate ABC transporter permease, partial [Acetatifactor sp.]|nr:carbohydrate ABC transporter permease [Acetatifactor sp.]